MDKLDRTQRIVDIVSDHFKLDPEKVRTEHNKREYVKAKQIICYFCSLKGIRHKKIIKALDYKWVNIVFYNRLTVKNHIEIYPKYAKDIERITKKIDN